MKTSLAIIISASIALGGCTLAPTGTVTQAELTKEWPAERPLHYIRTLQIAEDYKISVDKSPLDKPSITKGRSNYWMSKSKGVKWSVGIPVQNERIWANKSKELFGQFKQERDDAWSLISAQILKDTVTKTESGAIVDPVAKASVGCWNAIAQQAQKAELSSKQRDFNEFRKTYELKRKPDWDKSMLESKNPEYFAKKRELDKLKKDTEISPESKQFLSVRGSLGDKLVACEQIALNSI
jgi:hypothetical protein